MAEAEKATDEQVDAMFGDLGDTESDASEIDVAVPEHTPATEEVVDNIEQDEVETEVPEVSEEVDASTETEATQKDTVQAEEVTEITETVTEYEIDPELAKLEKDDILQRHAETEVKRRDMQSKLAKADDSLKTLNHIESTTGMQINEMLSLFNDLGNPDFQQYLQSWYNGTPEDLTAQTVRSTEKSPQDFMPEGKEYDKDDALDVSSDSGRAYLNYTRWDNQQQQVVEANRVNQQNIQASQKKAKQWILDQGQDIAEFDKYLEKFNSPFEVAKLVYAEKVRSEKATAAKNKKVDDVLTKVRTNKTKIGSISTVAGVESPQATEVSSVRKELDDVFGDYK